MTSALWWHKIFIVFVPIFSNNKYSASIHKQVPGGSTTTHQGIWTESCPLMHSWLWTLKWCVNLLSSLLTKVWEPLENTNIESHRQRRELLWKSRFTEIPAFCLDRKRWFRTHWSGQLLKTGGGGFHLECKDSNAKLTGTSKIKETWHHQKITTFSSYQTQRHGNLWFTL